MAGKKQTLYNNIDFFLCNIFKFNIFPPINNILVIDDPHITTYIRVKFGENKK